MTGAGPHGTLLLSVPTGHNVANVLRGGVLDELRRRAPDLKIVLVSPFVVDPKFRAEFSRPGVVFEPLPPYDGTVLERLAESVLSEQFLRDSGLRAVRLQRDRARLLDPRPGRRSLVIAKSAISRLPVSRSTWLRIARAVTRRRGCVELYDRMRPSLLVSSTGGFFTSELPLIAEAARRAVPHVIVDIGWDNLSSKYRVIRPADRLTVWNEQMREAAVRHHGFARDRVRVTGAVQFDLYADEARLPPRVEFRARIGAREGAKVVTLATPGRSTHAASVVAERLARAIQSGQLGGSVHLLVRVHPRDVVGAYRRCRKLPYVTVEKPISQLTAIAGTPTFDDVAPTTDDRRHLAATLAYSDVVINLASTTTLEACLFDTPVVNIGFDDRDGLPLPLSGRRYYHYEHYQPVLRAGAVRVAGDPGELIRAVREYLDHPEQDRDARRAIAAELCGPADGRASARVVETIMEPLEQAIEAAPRSVR